MKNDDLFDLSEYLDESYIEEVGRMRVSNDIKGYDGQNSDIICINKNSWRKLPKAAAGGCLGPRLWKCGRACLLIMNALDTMPCVGGGCILSNQPRPLSTVCL